MLRRIDVAVQDASSTPIYPFRGTYRCSVPVRVERGPRK